MVSGAGQKVVSGRPSCGTREYQGASCFHATGSPAMTFSHGWPAFFALFVSERVESAATNRTALLEQIPLWMHPMVAEVPHARRSYHSMHR